MTQFNPEQLAELRGIIGGINEYWQNIEGYCVFCGAWNAEGESIHIHMMLGQQPVECPVLTARKLLAVVEGMGE